MWIIFIEFLVQRGRTLCFMILTLERTEDSVGNNSSTTMIRQPTIWLVTIVDLTKKSNYSHHDDLPESIYMYLSFRNINGNVYFKHKLKILNYQ